MDENNTEMNGIGKEESAFVSELEESIGLPKKENASGTAEPESMKTKNPPSRPYSILSRCSRSAPR